MFQFTKKYGRYLSTIMTVIMILVMFPGSLARADNSVDIDVTNWDDWYVYDHYDDEGNLGYPSTDPRFTPLRPYYPIVESQAINNGDITTIPALLGTGAWRSVHHLKEHVSLVEVLKTGFSIYDVVFMGYGEKPYTDFLIYPETGGGVKSFGYDIYALNIDTHTLSSAGFLLNAGVDAAGYLHGYVLLIGFPDSYSGGSFDGARMYLYKILENGETNANGGISPGVLAADVHHADNYPQGAFSNQGNMKPNQLPEMNVLVDGRMVVLLDTDGDGEADHIGFRQSGSVADNIVAGIYDTSGNIIAQVLIDGEDVIIDNSDYIQFYDGMPFRLDDERVGLMSMPMDIDLSDSNNTIIDAEVKIDGVGTVPVDGDKYVLKRDGVYVKSDSASDPGVSDYYWVRRPDRWADTSFVPGHSWVSVDGTEYELDNDAYYLEGNSLFIRDDSGAGLFESFWMGGYSIISGQVTLNDAAPIPYDPATMWLESIGSLGNVLCVSNPVTGVISAYFLDGVHSYFTSDTLVELSYGNPDAGIVPGTYALDGTEAYMDNGYVMVRKNIHYHTRYIDGTSVYVVDSSQFKLMSGQIVETDGTNVKFEGGNLVISGPRYAYSYYNWSGMTYPTKLEVEVNNHEVLPGGLYALGTNGVGWDSDGYLYAPVAIYVIDGVSMYIENGVDIRVEDDLLYIFPDGVDLNEPGRAELYSESSSSRIDEVIKLDGVNNYIDTDKTVHLAPRMDRYYFNYDNLLQVGTLTNPGEFFAPENKKTSVLHLDVTFTDDELTITSSVPGGDGDTKKEAIIKTEGSLTFQGDGVYRGFGPYVEYQSHSCSSLTSFRFSNMTMGAVPQHKLKFDLNTTDSAAAPGSIEYLEVDEGALIGDLPAGAEPTRPNYNFLGWAKKPYATAPDYPDEDERMGFEDITVYAVWEAKSVEVIFYDGSVGYDAGYAVNNGSEYGKRYGDKLTAFPAPEDGDGIDIFVGWYTADDVLWDFANDTITDGNAPGEQLILHAKWATASGTIYTLTFDAGGGHEGLTTSKKVVDGESAGTLPSAEAGDAPTRDGHDFIGWSTSTGSLTPDFDENGVITGDTTVYAVWEPKVAVTLDLGGGAFEPLLDPQYADKGEYKLPVVEPTWDNHRFIGWEWSSNDYVPGDVIGGVTAPITVVAQWEPLYAVEIIYSYADVSGEGMYEEDDIVTINAGNRGSEWVFMGWDITSGGVTLADSTSKKTTFAMPSGPVTITAIWHEFGAGDYDFPAETHEVMFNANGGHPAHIEYVEDGEKVVEPTEPTRSGYDFLGWYTAETGGDLWDFNDPITESIVLYAHWKDLDPQHTEATEATVRFDYQDGSEVDAVTVDLGDPADEPGNPVREGYIFKGWFTAPSGGGAWDFGTAISRDISLYAHWEAVMYTVTFDSLGGTAVASTEAENGKTVTAPANPTKSGYSFKGWYTEETGGSLWNFRTGLVTEDMILYARWGKSGGGSSPETQASATTTPEERDSANEDSRDTETTDDGVADDDDADVTDNGDNDVADSQRNDEQQQLQQGQDLQQNILMPEGANPKDFAGVDLTAHQADQSKSGGKDHHAPPVANNPGNLLSPQFDAAGNLIFVELADIDNVPLGHWIWDEELEEWVFIDYMTPLGDMPKTGGAETTTWPMAAALAILTATLFPVKPKRI